MGSEGGSENKVLLAKARIAGTSIGPVRPRATNPAIDKTLEQMPPTSPTVSESTAHLSQIETLLALAYFLFDQVAPAPLIFPLPPPPAAVAFLPCAALAQHPLSELGPRG